jgi:hypothetical protein
MRGCETCTWWEETGGDGPRSGICIRQKWPDSKFRSTDMDWEDFHFRSSIVTTPDFGCVMYEDGREVEE